MSKQSLATFFALPNMQPSPRKRPHPRYAGPTRFAKKYGHPEGGIHSELENYLPEVKSGLTPVTPAQFLDNQDQRDVAKNLELYQRMRFRGFTAAELESVLALADCYETTSRRINYGNNLDNVPIHPMWARENWQYDLPRHIARYPFGDGNEYWEASDSPCTNADVILTTHIRPRMTLSSAWRAMEPALKLASSVIANIHTWEWFNSLLKGPWERVSPKDLPPDYPLNVTRFFSKEDRKDRELKSDIRDFFQKLSKYTYFALSGGKWIFCNKSGMSMELSPFSTVEFVNIDTFYNWSTYKHEQYSEAPVLSPGKQKDWENIIYYPIPVSYFMSLQSREFWDVHVRKYGSKAAHAGPR
ncbi:predicted protein [Sclerotinia sclerotiorum 1980 UF-70]|uniref:Uncharacterized protein n=1 Tax=Sclerotinia sclerotiorum (strain ATCC 18683 / 1980 / Ss-1) TaxID=665079 RepID=A7EW91_SCLS1|nr:predicted protein [Sclerotinia sclerotiorum 1980 UF-70]EDN93733.1 predicted protein [Sclerotinia sclerotiorum 1980 UF-70]